MADARLRYSTPMMRKQVSFALVAALWSSAAVFGQAQNTLSAADRAQGWQLLFDGTTLAGWNVSAQPQGGRTGPPPEHSPGTVDTTRPCAGEADASATADAP